jgi:hypothetical protein
MMQKKTLTITVSATGSITAEASGPGPGCAEELAAIQRLLPDTVIADSRLTPAYYQAVSQEVGTQQLQHEADNRP